MYTISEKSLQQFLYTDDSFSLLAIDLFDKLTPIFLNNMGLFEKFHISFNIDNDSSLILVENNFFIKESDENFNFNQYKIMTNSLLTFEGNFVFDMTKKYINSASIESFYCFFNDMKVDDDIDDGVVLIRGNYAGNLTFFNDFKKMFCLNVAPEILKAYMRIFHSQEKLKDNKDFLARVYLEKLNTVYHLNFDLDDVKKTLCTYLLDEVYNDKVLSDKIQYAYERFFNEKK